LNHEALALYPQLRTFVGAVWKYTHSAYGESLSIALGAFAIALVASYDQDCGSVGQGGGLAPGALPLSGGAGIVFHYPGH
jgi:hypothetical protein